MGVSKGEALALCLLAPECCRISNNTLQKQGFVPRGEGEIPQAAAMSPRLLMGGREGEVTLLQPGAFLAHRLMVASSVVTHEALFHLPDACIRTKAL